jgi:4-hydroxy-tetrahydrodipicolinate synthase
LEGNFEEARRLHYKCLEGNDLLFAENNPAGVKAFLARQGIISNYLRLPLTPLSKELDNKVQEFLSQYNK